MKKIILKESQIRWILEQEVAEGRGKWKDEWNKDDQILAFYNAKFGVESLGTNINEKYIANKIIGSSVGSLTKQTLNFVFLMSNGSEGFADYGGLQTEVFHEYKTADQKELKKTALDIIERREANPEESVIRYSAGHEIAAKREKLKSDRDAALRKLGKDPSKMKLIKQTPKKVEIDPDDVEDDPIDSTPKPTNRTPMGEVVDYLSSSIELIDDIKKSGADEKKIDKLKDDIEFIISYIKDEMGDGEQINEMIKIIRSDDVSLISKVKILREHLHNKL